MGAHDERPELLRKLKSLQRERERERTNSTVLWGFVLLGCTFVFFVVSIYALVVSKLMPHTGNEVSFIYNIIIN